MKSKNLYEPKAVYNALVELTEKGYEIVTLEGCLLDDYICLSHDKTKYNFFFYEVALNEWQSAYKMQRFSVMPKFLQERVAEYINSDHIGEVDALDLTALLTLAEVI